VTGVAPAGAAAGALLEAPADAAAAALAAANPDARLRLQWLRETALGSDTFTPTNNVFFDVVRAARALPGAMRFEATTGAWRRGAPEGAPAGAPTPRLVFPGDEGVLGSSGGGAALPGSPAGAPSAVPAAPAPAEAPPAPVVHTPVAPLALEPGAFLFVPNVR
jgi:hypothetical protein